MRLCLCGWATGEKTQRVYSDIKLYLCSNTEPTAIAPKTIHVMKNEHLNS